MSIISNFLKISLLAIALLFAQLAQAKATHWQQLSTGIQFTQLNNITKLGGEIYAFRIDPQHYKLDLAFSSDHGKATSDVKRLGKKESALIAINGGFFKPGGEPLGLRIQDGFTRSSLHTTKWWSVFLSKSGRQQIVSLNQFKKNKSIDFAVQSGPRLIINGTVPKLKPGVANRSALCITRDKKIILAVSQKVAISTTVFANLLNASEKQGGLNCLNALNLDGGRSTQIYANIGKFSLFLPGFSNVSDAVIVLPRR